MSAPKHLLSGIEETLGPDLLQKIQSSKILLVGAGGIGCELLKNLALTGFRQVDVVDLDTIDVSNLNRQLLFRSEHVGMPKCTVAAQVATQLAGDPSLLTYTPHHGNVCDNSQFNVPFVKQFDLVLNALDNVVARRRVNRLCLAASVPLVEAGTTGYLGQVNVIHKDTACYECQTQEQQKVYPICTIRSTPSMPVHTIVWAKELYKILFGEKVDESMLFEDPAGEEPSTYMQAVLDFRTVMEKAKAAAEDASNNNNSGENVSTADHAKILITTLYQTEIQKQLDMDRYKTASKKPVVSSSQTVETGMAKQAPTKTDSYSQMDIWSAEECVSEFAACLQDAVADPAVVLSSFDKDDSLSMRFVTATSNLRSIVFGIEPLQSFYSAKGIAGNIIPAIATTNAICAGLQILQAFSILRAQLEGKGDELKEICSYINCLRNKTRNGLFLTSAALEDPNPNCFVCKSAVVPLALNTTKWTLQDFIDKIVKKDLGFEEPTLMLGDGDCIWEEGEDSDQASFEKNLAKLLTDLPCGGIGHAGAVVTIEDFSQDLTVNVSVTHQEVWEKEEDEDEEDDYKYVIGGNKPLPSAVAKKDETEDAKTNGDTKKSADDDDDIEIVDGPSSENGDLKRSAEESADVPPAKKAKTSAGGDHDVIEID
jgi:ubiquitin-like 1-activating enzyme E1 B